MFFLLGCLPSHQNFTHSLPKNPAQRVATRHLLRKSTLLRRYPRCKGADAAPIYKRAVNGDLGEQIIHIVSGTAAFANQQGFVGGRTTVTQAVHLFALGVGATQHVHQQAIPIFRLPENGFTPFFVQKALYVMFSCSFLFISFIFLEIEKFISCSKLLLLLFLNNLYKQSGIRGLIFLLL